MSQRTRWILVAALAGVLVVLAFVMGDSALEVDTARIERDTLRVTVTEEGRTRVRERYVVAAPVAGRLARIEVDEGDAVAPGTRLAQIDQRPEGARDLGIARAKVAAAEARRQEATARAEEARTRLKQLRREAKRSRALAADSILSQQEFEQDELAAVAARRQLEAALSALRAAEADLAAARATLTGTRPERAGGEAVAVQAPSAGAVLRVLEESERVVQAGTPLIEIGDAEGLEVVVDVLTEDAVRIDSSAPVRIEEWGGGYALQGRVRRVEPDAFTETSALGVEEQRVNVIVDLRDVPAALGSGYRVEAHVVTWEGSGVLTVPTSALFQQDGAWHVFVVEEGNAVLRPVRIGHRAAEAAEVLQGLGEDETVIVFPSDQIQEGTRVQARPE